MVPIHTHTHHLRFGIWNPKTYPKQQTSGGIRLDVQGVIYNGTIHKKNTHKQKQIQDWRVQPNLIRAGQPTP